MDLSSEVYASKPVVECKTDDVKVEVKTSSDAASAAAAYANGLTSASYPASVADTSSMYAHNGYPSAYYGDPYATGGYDPATAAYYASQGWAYPHVSSASNTDTQQDDGVTSEDRKRGYPEDSTEGGEQDENGSGDDQKLTGRLGLSSVPGLDELWAQVSTDFTDFDSWTKLLAKSETCEDIKEVNQAYDVFLDRYPLCFGYWKKYADILRKRNHSNEDVLKVFERGVTAIPQSVELWIHYINFATTACYAEQTLENTALIRKLFERAVDGCGFDFKSDKLWDAYVNWERQNCEFLRVTLIYDRLFKVPTQKHAEHFEKFKAHIGSQEIQELIEDSELNTLLKHIPSEDVEMAMEVTEDNGKKEDTPPKEEVKPEPEDESEPKVNSGIDEEVKKETDGEEEVKDVKEERKEEQVAVAKSAPKFKFSEEVSEKLRNLVVERRIDVYEELKTEIEKITPFEEQLRRNYFHVKPLEKAQLNAWKDYIKSFIDREKNSEVSRERVLFLFERCIITCCYYEEYWLKYIAYLESNGLITKAQEVFSRAGRTHLPKKINFHLEWANFEEKHGFKENAIKVLSDLESYHPEVVKIPVLKAGVYRRMWSLTQASEALQNAINNVKVRDHFVYLTMKLARFKAKVEGDFNGACEVLQQALKKYPVNEKLHTCLVDLEYSARQVINVKSFCEACDNVTENNQIPLNTRVKFCQRKLELLEDVGTELSEIVAAREEYAKLCKDNGINPSSAADLGEPPEKKSRMSNVSGDPNSQYPNYYYPWSYYGAQQYGQQYPTQYWGGHVPVTGAASTTSVDSTAYAHPAVTTS